MIRLANKPDISKLAVLKLKMFQEVNLEYLLLENFIEEVEKSYCELYEVGKALHFVITDDHDEIVACAGGFIKDEIPYCFYKERCYGFIGDVYVEKAFRRKGYAKKLTNEVLDWFSKKEISTIRLLASSNARKLYESLGFEGTDEMILHR